MIRKSLVALIFVALLALTLTQVVDAGSKNGNGSKPTSAKPHPTPKPKPSSPKESTVSANLSGFSRFLFLDN